jgi:RNA polymerase sigma-70 factor (ECF subfamily)
MYGSPAEADELLSRLRQGDVRALGDLFARCRERLRVAVALRLDRRLQGRLDPSDVVQDAYLEATARFAEYVRRPAQSPYLWLRLLTVQRLHLAHRQHLGVRARDARREAPTPEVSSEVLAAQLAGSVTSPSQALARAEALARLQDALGRMDPLDREILSLRHFEQLSNAEAAEALGLRAGTASQRYYRALRRLKEVLEAVNGTSGGLCP